MIILDFPLFVNPESFWFSSSFFFLLNPVHLQQPRISLTSPDRELVWSPEGAEVTEGHRFVVLCSVNSSYPKGQFFLISPDQNIILTKPAINQSATFDFPVAQYEHQGNYSCVYEADLTKRRVNSSETAPIRLLIKGKQTNIQL